ncbi:MAG: hypothetical protein HC788_13095 [Sphingopyxis sp.]|nr:hypothetical protein [Sphingopyxis sp.]
MIAIPAPLRLRLDSAALVHNWRWLAQQSGSAATGAAIKADGYGLGARGVMERLYAAGCRDFFVATWAEAAALQPVIGNANLSVLHGVRAADMPVALREKVTKAILDINPNDPVGKEILTLNRATKYVPTKPENYKGLEAAARSAGLLK